MVFALETMWGERMPNKAIEAPFHAGHRWRGGDGQERSATDLCYYQ